MEFFKDRIKETPVQIINTSGQELITIDQLLQEQRDIGYTNGLSVGQSIGWSSGLITGLCIGILGSIIVFSILEVLSRRK